jgi:hypothetical protein
MNHYPKGTILATQNLNPQLQFSCNMSMILGTILATQNLKPELQLKWMMAIYNTIAEKGNTDLRKKVFSKILAFAKLQGLMNVREMILIAFLEERMMIARG